jgi:RNA polymerase sigma factor (sigma-70 family)
MAKAKLDFVAHYLHKLTGPRAAEDDTDGPLMERFAATREEEAFAALLQRHGPLVLRVCRRVLRQSQDVEDVFQATFLVLARQARSIRKRSSVASWLHGVAYHLAVKARAKAARRQTCERHATDVRPAGPTVDLAWRELVAALDEELQRLPDKYRAPLVLCYLEGTTQEEAARQLGWPLGTVRGRLARAREQLRARLTRRGLTLSAGALATTLVANSAAGEVPASLAGATLKAAIPFSLGQATAADAASTEAVALAEGLRQTMAAGKLKLAAALLLAAGALVGAQKLPGLTPPGSPPPAAAPPEQSADPATPPEPEAREGPEQKKQPTVDREGEPLPAGALARLGTARFYTGDWNASVVYSPDGKLLAVTRVAPSDDQVQVRVWDRASGKELYQVPGNVAAFSPDSKTLATGASRIHLWDAASGKPIRRFGGLALCLAFSPNGKLLASGYSPPGSKGRVRIWEADTGKEVHEFGGDRYGLGSCLAFSPDGKTLATGYYEKPGDGNHGRVLLWATDTGKEIRVFEAGSPTSISAGGKAIAFVDGGRTLAWLCDDGAIYQWTTATGKDAGRLVNPRKTPWGSASPYRHFAATSDGKTLAAVTPWEVHLWDAAGGKLLRELPQFNDGNSGLAFAPDGKTLAVGGYRRVNFWDTATGQEQAAGHQSAVWSVAFAPDRKSLVSTGQDNVLRVWDRIAGQQLRQSAGVTNLLAFSPDGKTVALTTTRNTIELSDFATGNQRLVFPGSERLQGTVRLGAFSPDGKTLYGVSLRQGPDRGGPGNRPIIIDGTLHFWDAVTRKENRQVSIGQFCYGVAFSPDRRSLAVIDHEATVHVWELATGKQRHEFRGMGPAATFAADGKGLTGIGYSPDGRMLAIWGHRRGLERSPAKTQLLDAATGKERRKIEGAGGAVAFSPDGRLVVAVKDDHQTLGLWDVLTGKEVRAFEGHRSVVNCVAFAPDGKTLASGSDDTAVLVWDVATLLRGETALQRPERPKTAELSPRELGLLWADLGGADVPRAFQAVLTLADASAQSVPFLKERVQPAVMDRERIARCLKDLDSEDFETREKAEAELQLGDLAEPALRQVLETKPSPEVRRRVDALLRYLGPAVPAPEQMKLLRAVEVLERSRTPEAKALLERLSAGAPEARLTQDAKAALERLAPSLVGP